MRWSGAREFVIDTIVVGVTQVLIRARGLITLPLIVGILGTASYGVWAQTISFVGLTVAVLGLNLHLPLVRFIAGDARQGGTVYSTLLLATLALVVGGGAIVAALSGPLSAALIGDDGLERYLQVAMLLVLVGTVRQLNQNVYRATGRLVARSVIELITNFGELVGIFVLLRLGCSLLQVFVFMAAWEALAAVATTAHGVAILGWASPRWTILTQALAYTLPLVPAGLAVWVLDRADRFVVGHYRGLEGVGIYSANYALGSLLMLLQTPFTMTLLPKVSALWDSDRPLAKRYIELSTKAFLTLGIPFAIGLPMLAPYLLRRLGNAEIAAAAGWTTFLISAGVLLSGVGNMQLQIFYGARRTALVGVVSISAAILNLALNFALVPIMGVNGAALATFIAYAAICAAYTMLARPILMLDWSVGYFVKCTAAAGLMALFFRWASPAHVTTLLGVGAAGIVLYFACLLALRAFSAEELAQARRGLRRPTGGRAA